MFRPSSERTLTGHVIFFGVLLDHAPGIKLRYQRDHRMADHLNPATGNSIFIPLKKRGNHLLGQNLEQILTIRQVLFFDGVGMSICANSKTVSAIIAFPPPPIENAQIHTTVATCLLSACARSFEWPARVIEPNITAGHHLSRDVHVVILDEYEGTFEFTIFAQVNNVLNVTLAFIITGMCLAGENKLDWSRCIAGEANNLFKLLEDQRRSLVSRKSPGETNGEGVRIQQLVESNKIALAETLPLDQQTTAGELDQFPPELIT